MLCTAAFGGGVCRQLIRRVLSSCKPCWLAEPQLVADISSKLLADLQQLLPSQPASEPTVAGPQDVAVAPAAAAGDDDAQFVRKGAGPEAGECGVGSEADTAPQQQLEQDEQQHQEQQHKFVALLSCLVAILHAAGRLPHCQGLLADTATLMAIAHDRCCAASSSSSTEAVTTLASLMLVLWQSIASAHVADEAVAAAATASEGGDNVAESSAAAAAAGNNRGKLEGGAGEAGATCEAAAAGSSSRMPDMLWQAWAAVVRTLHLPLLSGDGAVGLLESVSSAVAGLADVQQAGQQWLQLVHSLPARLFDDTLHLRCAPFPQL